MSRLAFLLTVLSLIVPIAPAQDTPIPAPRSSWATDQVTLDNGALFEGRIVAESDTTMTLRIGFGGTIDLPLWRIVERLDLEPSGDDAPLETQTEWYRLHDRFGSHIGTRRIVQRASEYQRRPCHLLEEILHLQPNEGPTLHITWQESLSRDGEILGFFYREAEGDRERTIRGDFEADGRVLLEEVRNGKRRHWRETWPEDRWLPLTYRLARPASPAVCRVWDPRRGGDLIWTRSELPARTVALGAGPVRVERFRIERAGIASELWIDPERDLILNEELQGPDLRAMSWLPEAEASELAPIRHLELGFHDGLKRVAAFAPHPGWMVRLPARRPDEVVTIFERATGAEIAVLMPRGDRSHAELAELLALEFAGPGSLIRRTFATSYRNRAVSGAIATLGDQRTVRSLIWEWDGEPLAIIFVAAPDDLDELGEDFDRFLARLRCGER